MCRNGQFLFISSQQTFFRLCYSPVQPTSLVWPPFLPARPGVSGPAPLPAHASAFPPPLLILSLGLCSHLCLHLPA